MQLVTQMESRLAAMGHTTIKSSEWLAIARQSLARCDERIGAGDLAQAYLEARRAQRPLQRIERAQWEEAIKPLPSPLTSPLVATYATLPEHYRFVSIAGGNRWGPNELPGGGFEDFNELIAARWQHLQNKQDGVTANIELSTTDHHTGRMGMPHLRQTRRRRGGAGHHRDLTGVGRQSVGRRAGWPMGSHQWLGLRSQGDHGSVEGLMVIDSQNGVPMAERIGVAEQWQAFSMMRTMPQSGPLSVTFALTGLGEAFIDDIAIERYGGPDYVRPRWSIRQPRVNVA